MTTEKPISNLAITPEQFEQIKQAEAIAVHNYESSQGRFGELAMIGAAEECQACIDTPTILLVYDTIRYLGSEVVLVSDLLPPDEVTP